ncbi:hypothetical protein COMA2_160033 [Candidatus Nitrospira nitrificans]|uniref:Uncharacterized protein n=1 Tax=Candidatus Nitrospira nitrificans TaxID=1742973 RepID=A0A0S4L8T1_9BACT|nr:hypothetical protein COMA2_160033 [Candidatus Nitrospira nitrificans]
MRDRLMANGILRSLVTSWINRILKIQRSKHGYSLATPNRFVVSVF